MQQNDHYTILELAPSATQEEIKKAYRRLVQQYHPDKTNNDPYARAYFDAVKEAYETLTNTSRRDEYHNERWLKKSGGIKNSSFVLTPVSVLQKCIILEKQFFLLNSSNPANQIVITHAIEQLFTADHIEKLNAFNETDINDTILTTVLKMTQLLNYKNFHPLVPVLQKINTGNTPQTLLQKMVREKKLENLFEKSLPFLVITAVILICLFIYFFAS
ncbi:J domain-containing protein [Terrimonas rubra]|uniref:J domain-containing protein n=1 Tax=Terrimonas rubra TaxID=1035890 RepID=A0ABW6A7D5_9BACT